MRFLASYIDLGGFVELTALRHQRHNGGREFLLSRWRGRLSMSGLLRFGLLVASFDFCVPLESFRFLDVRIKTVSAFLGLFRKGAWNTRYHLGKTEDEWCVISLLPLQERNLFFLFFAVCYALPACKLPISVYQTKERRRKSFLYCKERQNPARYL